MKKYIITYVAIFLVAILLIITGGIPWMKEVAYVREIGFDGLYYVVYLLPGNILIAAICLGVSLVITIRSSNRIPKKWLILFGISVIILLFNPVVYEVVGGGFAGRIRKRCYYDMITFMPEMVELIFLDLLYNSMY